MSDADPLAGATDFQLRRAVERLREGLFDPLAVRVLTVHHASLRRAIDAGLSAARRGEPAHLCIVGAYGYGKSHSLAYLDTYARSAGFATSFVNLDPREVSFHRFRDVFRHIVTDIRVPDSDEAFPKVWRARVGQRFGEFGRTAENVSRLIPEETPPLLRSVLMAMALPTVSLSEKERLAKKHADYRPREIPYTLRRALVGEPVPVARLKKAIDYRQVERDRRASLSFRGEFLFLDMMRSLSLLLKNISYSGWVVLFDEGEAIAQAPVSSRRKSYRLLHGLFFPEPSRNTALYPVFGFTEDFFQRVADEDYARTEGDEGPPYFERRYDEAWRRLTRHRLEPFTPAEWEALSVRLVRLHARAYRWQPDPSEAGRLLRERLASVANEETRYVLKALVDRLDVLQQERSAA